MGIVKWLLVVGVVGYGVHTWKGHADKAEAAALRSPTGFMPVTMPDGARRNAVLILAPKNCPEAGARRAEDLDRELSRRGFTTIRSDTFHTAATDPTAEQRASIERAVAVVNGEVPAVFINGMGKANPTADEVVAEIERTR